jgi:hypothetical protein
MTAFAGEKLAFLADFTLEKAGRDPHSSKTATAVKGGDDAFTEARISAGRPSHEPSTMMMALLVSAG